jgi:cell division protein FtsX
VTFVSKEKAFEIYKEATSDNPLLAELVSPTIFPSSLEFSVVDLTYTTNLIEELKLEKIVDNVGFTASLGSEDNLGDVIDRLKTVRVGCIGLALTLAGASFLVLMVIIGMRISTRKKEIETLDLIGATAGFIRTPIVIEAVYYAVVGVIVGWVASLILILYATPSIISYFGTIPVLPKDSGPFFILLVTIFAGELFIGILIALLGSLVAVSRARRK